MLCKSFTASSSCKEEFVRPICCKLTKVCRLLFMTYNGFVMLAVAVGAFIGYLAFGSGLASTKSVACH